MSDARVRASKTASFGTYFWGTIFVLIAISLVLVLLAAFGSSTVRDTVENSEPPSGSITKEALDQVGQRARKAGQTVVEANLDDALDQMFRPVYASIPKYTDFHYSVMGQYAELFAAAAETTGLEEKVGSLMRKHLFEGFETRYESQMTRLDDVYRQTVSDVVEEESRRLSKESRKPLPEATKLVIDDLKHRLLVTAPTATTGSVAATAAMVAIVKPIATKVVASTALKAGAKGIGKATGAGGAAAAGAAAGSFLGPVGTAVGGIGGAVIGWLVVDYTVVKLDEYFNRDEFENELHAAIDEQKARMKRKIIKNFAVPAS